MMILDLDMDYFMEDIATGIAESREERLAEDEYGDCVWSEYRIRKFLEDNLGLSKEKKIKGRIVTGHNEALFFWQELITKKVLQKITQENTTNNYMPTNLRMWKKWTTF